MAWPIDHRHDGWRLGRFARKLCNATPLGVERGVPRSGMFLPWVFIGGMLRKRTNHKNSLDLVLREWDLPLVHVDVNVQGLEVQNSVNV